MWTWGSMHDDHHQQQMMHPMYLSPSLKNGTQGSGNCYNAMALAINRCKIKGGGVLCVWKEVQFCRTIPFWVAVLPLTWRVGSLSKCWWNGPRKNRKEVSYIDAFDFGWKVFFLRDKKINCISQHKRCWFFLCQVEIKFHSRESNRPPLHLILDLSIIFR